MTDKTILIVDDEPAILAQMNQNLTPLYKVRAATSGERALQVAVTKPIPDLILLDVSMPGIDGYSVLEKLKEIPKTKNIPVIFITAMEAMQDEKKGLQMGAVDYLTKPVNPAVLLARVNTHIVLKQAHDFLHNKNDYLEAEIARRMAENLTIQEITIRALANLAEIRDPETGTHILRTQSYIKVLAKHLQTHPRFKAILTDQYIELLSHSAPLHDIGKVGIPDHILLKPGKLNQKEWHIMKTHCELGARAIDKAEKDVGQSVQFLTLAKEISHWHHERWDGKGYPDGLSKEDIPLSARLMTIADVFDALISSRVYKKKFNPKKIRKIIIKGKGHQFDPDITDAFLSNFDEFLEIARSLSENKPNRLTTFSRPI